MAYVPDASATDPSAPPTAQPAPAGNAPMNLPPAPMTSSGAAGTSGSVSGPSGQGVAATPNSAAQPPVQNLQDYLTANQPQAVAMGNQIASNLTEKAGQVTGDIGADLSAIDKNVQASNVAPNPDLVNRAAADPSTFVQNPDDVAAFIAQRDAGYKGPNTIEETPEWASLNTEVENAVAGAPDVTKPGGWLQLAAGQETNPTAGMTNLDAALLQGTPEAGTAVSDAVKPFAGLKDQYSTAATAEDAAIAKAKANGSAASGLIAPAFTTGPNAAVPAWEKALQNKINAADTSTSSFNDQVSKDVAMQNALKSLLSGFESTSGMPVAYSPPTYSPITNMPDAAGVASPGDYAMEAALSQLLGSRFSGAPLDPANASKAGTFTPPSPAMTEADIAKAYATPIHDTLMNAPINQRGAMPQSEVDALTSLAKYLGQFDPAQFHPIPGTPSQSWVYP